VPKAVSSRLVDLACLGVVTVWGVNFVVMKRALQRFDVATFNVVRFTGMVTLGWLLLAVNHRRRGHALLPDPADRARIAFAGGVGFFGYLYGFTVGLSHTTAFSSSLLTGMSSLFVALLLWATGVETLSRRHLGALVLALVGAVVFVVGRSDGRVVIKWGDAVSLGAAFLYASYLVINRPLTKRYPAASLTTWSMTVAYVVVLAVGGPLVHRQDWSRIDTRAWLSMGWAMTLPVFIAWSVWAWANGRAGVARPALFLVFVPVVSGVAAWWALNEKVRVLQIVGLALVVCALIIGSQRTTAASSAGSVDAEDVMRSGVAGAVGLHVDGDVNAVADRS
jgi:O-acetylserine/cysteine efflux transporter